jgi:hypothetical protein
MSLSRWNMDGFQLFTIVEGNIKLLVKDLLSIEMFVHFYSSFGAEFFLSSLLSPLHAHRPSLLIVKRQGDSVSDHLDSHIPI